jgi:ATP synthase protein I
MTGVSRSGSQHIVPLILLAQVGMSVCLALGIGVWQGRTVGVSILLGGITAFAPNAFLAARVMNPRSASLMQSLWVGEIGKLALTVVLFGAIFALIRPISPLAVFCGFIATHLVILFALLLSQRAG